MADFREDCVLVNAAYRKREIPLIPPFLFVALAFLLDRLLWWLFGFFSPEFILIGSILVLFAILNALFPTFTSSVDRDPSQKRWVKGGLLILFLLASFGLAEFYARWMHGNGLIGG